MGGENYTSLNQCRVLHSKFSAKAFSRLQRSSARQVYIQDGAAAHSAHDIQDWIAWNSPEFISKINGYLIRLTSLLLTTTSGALC